jgi:hypothetical protein
MDYFPDISGIDLREEFDALLYGRSDVTPIGRQIMLRRIIDQKCVCWDELKGGPNRLCIYCQGEGYLWRETQETMAVFRGIAPVYKPGTMATGQYPQADYGYTDPNNGTAYARYSTYPDYERYTIPQHLSYDKMYELKVDDNGNLSYPLIRTIKWKVLSVVPLMGDFGRVEMFELALEKINI